MEGECDVASVWSTINHLNFSFGVISSSFLFCWKLRSRGSEAVRARQGRNCGVVECFVIVFFGWGCIGKKFG